MVQISHLYRTTGKTIALTRQTFAGKMMSLLFNMLSRFVIGEGNGTPLQYSCLENPMDGGACRLQSMGSLRVRHDWATSLSLFTFMHWRRKWQPIPVFLPGKSQGQGSLVGGHLWGRTESDTTERLHFHFPLSCIGEGNGNPLQCSCLENPRDRGACWAAIYGVSQSWTWLKT